MKRINNFWYHYMGTVICFSVPVVSMLVIGIVWLITGNFELANSWGLITLFIMCILAIVSWVIASIKIINPESKLRKYEKYLADEKIRLNSEGPLSKLSMFKDGAGI